MNVFIIGSSADPAASYCCSCSFATCLPSRSDRRAPSLASASTCNVRDTARHVGTSAPRAGGGVPCALRQQHHGGRRDPGLSSRAAAHLRVLLHIRPCELDGVVPLTHTLLPYFLHLLHGQRASPASGRAPPAIDAANDADTDRHRHQA